MVPFPQIKVSCLSGDWLSDGGTSIIVPYTGVNLLAYSVAIGSGTFVGNHQKVSLHVRVGGVIVYCLGGLILIPPQHMTPLTENMIISQTKGDIIIVKYQHIIQQYLYWEVIVYLSMTMTSYVICSMKIR